MITESAVLWLGTIALLTSYVGIARANNPLSRIIAFVVAFVFWAAFAMNALAYKIVSDAVTYSQGSQSLALIGVLGAVATMILLFREAFAAINEVN